MGCSKIRSGVVKKMIGDLRFGEEKVSSIEMYIRSIADMPGLCEITIAIHIGEAN